MIEIPSRFSSELVRKETHVLKLNKFLLGLKQAYSNWYHKHLNSTTLKKGQLFFKDGLNALVYVDHCIIIGKTDVDKEKFIVDSLKEREENFDFIEEEGSL